MNQPLPPMLAVAMKIALGALLKELPRLRRPLLQKYRARALKGYEPDTSEVIDDVLSEVAELVKEVIGLLDDGLTTSQRRKPS